MPETKSKMGLGGRVVIPSPYRKALGVKAGDELIIRLEEGEVWILTPRQALARAQALVRPYLKRGTSLADELIAERRKEAELE